MNKTSYSLLTTLLLSAAAPLYAQNELSNFTATGRGGVATPLVTDYQALGINPANLGRRVEGTPLVTVGLLELGLGAGSRSLTRDQLKNLVFHAEDGLSAADKQALTVSFTNGNALNVNAAAMSVGLSVALPVGTVALSNRQRVVGHVGLNQTAADVLFNGSNAQIYQAATYQTNGQYDPAKAPMISAALQGTELQLQWTDEYNVGYGAQVIDADGFKLSVGVGYRYIRGIGMLDVRVDDGEVNAFSSLSPLFKVNYGSVTGNPNFDYRTGSGLKSVGSGHGFDLGVTAAASDLVRVGVSLTDLGSMTWKGNVLTANDQALKKVTSGGVNTYNIFKEASQLFGSSSDAAFTYNPDRQKKEKLPAKLRAGAAFTITEKLDVGVDAAVPLNNLAGNLNSTLLGVGLDFKPVSWVRLSSGVTGGAGYGTSVPLGITFSTKHYEAGISTRDITGLISEDSPYYSVALGVLRFKFGQAK
ncbi:hypothetical protein J0X19_14995 [Hymenobacter sp. BT186]|uniref:DUF5723 domain-containing protein n=1 Tax=Hymenobacter telluris TaxID=2816474 RepID=A0A939EY18_9BACT|nr:DUF5723 family protein [Hymenobacter telluris]MBO0359267.1 hypothetical protein [Hymenobacter telluris]MBW3375293.1 hypothetical protein [Hymenobacter norwichensis]